MKFKGFTLVEMLIVILVMGILAGITIFTYQSAFKRSRLERAMNGVRAFYGRVNRRVVTEGYQHLIQVNKDKNVLRAVKSTDVLVYDSLTFSENLNLGFDGAKKSFILVVHVDGFVDDEDNIRDFHLVNTETGDSALFYISPLGVMEARLK